MSRWTEAPNAMKQFVFLASAYMFLTIIVFVVAAIVTGEWVAAACAFFAVVLSVVLICALTVGLVVFAMRRWPS